MNNPDSKPSPDRLIHVMAIEPFYGGSHKSYLEGVFRHSRHRWSLVTGKPVHWKWRMRSAPLELAGRAVKFIDEQGLPDVLWCSDMLDLPQFLGLARLPDLLDVPRLVYFHENQLTYPTRPEAREDFHYGYTNLVSALAADVCLFNSVYHRDEFLKAGRRFIERMPDSKMCHDLESLSSKSVVAYPGYEAREATCDLQIASSLSSPDDRDEGLTIGWVSRWEQDKRPDRFADLLDRIDDAGIDFRLVLLGPRPRQTPVSLERIRQQYGDRILFDEFAKSHEQYWQQIRRMDIVVSTADHEFFGIAICEAIEAGAVAVTPNRLSYPEIIDTPTRYDSIDQAADMICLLSNVQRRRELVSQGKCAIRVFQMEQTVPFLDECIDQLIISR